MGSIPDPKVSKKFIH